MHRSTIHNLCDASPRAVVDTRIDSCVAGRGRHNPHGVSALLHATAVTAISKVNERMAALLQVRMGSSPSCLPVVP